MRTLLLTGLVLALTISGCSSKSTTSTSTTTGSMTTGASTTTGPAMGATHEIHMLGNTFVNGTQTVYVGEKVTWIDDDAAPTAHSVTADDGSFDSSKNCAAGVPLSQVCMVKGSTFEHTFDTAGSFAYHCKVHASMTGVITVLAMNMTA